MIVLSGALVLVALVLLVFGAVDRNLPYVYASIGVSLLSLLLLVVGILQRRGELPDGEDDATTPVTDTTDEPVPALVGAGEGRADLPPAQEPGRPASRRVAPEPAAQEPQERAAEPVAVEDGPDEVHDDDADDLLLDDEVEDDEVEDDEVLDDAPEDEGLADDELDEGSGVTVLVVSGRPRYHLEGCRVLRGKEPQPLDRDDARTHGFSPCGVCKPDADETADGQDDEDGVSFTEALFGEPLFADGPARDAEADAPAVAPAGGAAPDVEPALTAAGPAQTEAQPAALPDRPVQPVLVEVDRPEPSVDDEPPLLQGEDPADDPSLEPVVDTVVEPAPDLAGDPDELAQAAAVVESPSVEEQPAGLGEPVVEPVAAEDVPVAAEPSLEQAPGAEVDAVVDAPVRRRRTSSPATARKATAAAEDAPVEEPAAAAKATAPAKRSAAKKAPAKKAPTKKAPTKKAPAKRAAAPAPAEPAPAPQVRRPVVRAVRADALRLGAPSTGVTTTRVSARAAAPAAAPSVVVVPDRDRFHRPQCRFVRDVAGATTLPKASAARQGYAACGVCKP